MQNIADKFLRPFGTDQQLVCEKIYLIYFTGDLFKMIRQMLGKKIYWPLNGGKKPY